LTTIPEAFLPLGRYSNPPFRLQSIVGEALPALQSPSRGYRAHNQDRFLVRHIRKYDDNSFLLFNSDFPFLNKTTTFAGDLSVVMRIKAL